MKEIKNFISNFEDSTIYERLIKDGFSHQAAVVIKTMLKMTINAHFSMKFSTIVKDAFNANKPEEQIVFLPVFIELFDKKFIQEASAKEFNHKENSGLILIYSLALTRLAHLYLGLASEFEGIKILNDDEFELFKHQTYDDLSIYLNDCFDMIDSRMKMEYAAASMRYDVIKSRLEKSKNFECPFLKMADEFKLSEEEILILIALAKEEITGSKKPLHYEELLNILSPFQLEKIRNYEFLCDDAPLLSNELISYIGNDNRFVISDNALKFIFPNKGENFKALVEEMSFFEYLEKQDLHLVLSDSVKELASNLKKRTQKSVAKRLKDWGITKDDKIRSKIIFYGPPGTGKTASASYLANLLKREIITLDCSKILDKYVGESEKNVRAIFDNYKELCKHTKLEPILLLNEADQFLSTRQVAGSGSELMHNQMQNIFLEQLERFSGILIATTNFLDSLDPAFARRFDYKIRFVNPSKKEREQIWKNHLPKKAEYEENFDLNQILDYELSGAQIELIVKNVAIKTAQGDAIFRISDFVKEIKKELDNDFAKDIVMGFN